MTLFVLDNSAALNVTVERTEEVPPEHGGNQSRGSLGAVSQSQGLIMLAHDALPPALRELDSELPMKVNPLEMLEEWAKVRDSGRGITYEQFCWDWRRAALAYLNTDQEREVWPGGRPILRDLPKWKSPQPKPRALRR